MTKQPSTNIPIFEKIKHFDDNGNEFWSARDLAKVLEYSEYRHFLPAIERAKEACQNSGQNLPDHFEDILDMIKIGKGGRRSVESIKLSLRLLPNRSKCRPWQRSGCPWPNLLCGPNPLAGNPANGGI